MVLFLAVVELDLLSGGHVLDGLLLVELLLLVLGGDLLQGRALLGLRGVMALVAVVLLEDVFRGIPAVLCLALG